MEKYKAKAIQADLGIFMHIPAYSDKFKHKQGIISHIQACSEPYVILAYLELWYTQNPGVLRTLAYSEPWFIQNTGIFRILAYSEPCQTSTMDHFRQNS